MKKKTTIITKIKGAKKKLTKLEPETAHLIGEFVIVVTFGDHVHHLASSLSNVIRQVDRQTKIPV